MSVFMATATHCCEVIDPIVAIDAVSVDMMDYNRVFVAAYYTLIAIAFKNNAAIVRLMTPPEPLTSITEKFIAYNLFSTLVTNSIVSCFLFLFLCHGLVVVFEIITALFTRFISRRYLSGVACTTNALLNMSFARFSSVYACLLKMVVAPRSTLNYWAMT